MKSCYVCELALGCAVVVMAGCATTGSRETAARHRSRHARTAQAEAAAAAAFGKADAIAMTQAKVSEEIISNQIAAASTVAPLTTPDIVELKNAGVSDNIINLMLNKARDQAAADAGAASETKTRTRTSVHVDVDPWFWPWVLFGPPPMIGPSPGPGPLPGPAPRHGPGPHP